MVKTEMRAERQQATQNRIAALRDALKDALHEAGHSCSCEKPTVDIGSVLHEVDCWTAKARAALRMI